MRLLQLLTAINRLHILNSKSHVDPIMRRWGVIGVKNTFADDFTHQCLDLDWPALTALVVGVYAAVALVCAAMFYALALARPDVHHILGDFPVEESLAEACWWFSVTNVITIGYGSQVGGSKCLHAAFCGKCDPQRSYALRKLRVLAQLLQLPLLQVRPLALLLQLH